MEILTPVEGTIMHEKRCRLGRIEVRYVEADGPPPAILFLHGVTDSLTSYRPAMEMLAAEVRMVAMDFRGHGGSGHAPDGYRVRDHAADVIELVGRIIGEPVVLAGHSLGAMVATCVVSDAPELCHGVLLEDPPFYSAQMPGFRDHPAYQMFAGLRELLRQHHANGESVEALAAMVGAWPVHPMLFEGRTLLEVAGPEVVRARADALHAMDAEALAAVLDGSQFEGFDPERALAAIAAPVHVLAGSPHLGGVIDARDVEHLATLVRRYTFRIMTDVGHFVHHTNAVDYVGELRAFMGSVNGKRS